MAADALVENNPQTFGGKLYEDLRYDTQMRRFMEQCIEVLLQTMRLQY